MTKPNNNYFWQANNYYWVLILIKQVLPAKQPRDL